MTTDHPGGPNSWAIRRRFMFAIATFCCAAIAWCLWRDLDSAVAEAAVSFAFLTLGSIVASYVFGATWDDANTRRGDGHHRRRRRDLDDEDFSPVRMGGM